MWGQGYITGFRYRNGNGVAWHITTVQPGDVHDMWMVDHRFHRIAEMRLIFDPPSSIFITDDKQAELSGEELAAVLTGIGSWERAGADSEHVARAG
jgi:hypothetical protein